MISRFKSLLHKYSSSKLLNSFIVTLLGSGLSRVILSVAVFIFANFLTKAEFGEFSFIRNTLNTILCICALNFSSICTKFVVDLEIDRDNVGRLVYLFLFILSVAILIGLSLICVPAKFWVKIFNGYTVFEYFKFIGTFLPLFIVQPMVEGILRGLMKFKLIGILQVSSSLIFILFVILGYQYCGLDGAIWGMLYYYLIYAIVSVVILFRINPFRNLSFSRSIIRKNRYVINKVLFPIFITSFIEAPILWIAQVLLVRWNNIESVGSVTAILQIRSLVILIPSYIFSTFLSFASKLNAQGEYSLYFKRFDTLAKVLLFASVSLSILLTLFSQQVLGLYGTEYRVDYLAMIISNVEIPLFLYSGLLKLDLIVQERQKQLMYISLIWNVIWLVLLYIFLRIEVDSVIAFFASQLIALTIYSVYIFILYNKDKKTLLSRLNETK